MISRGRDVWELRLASGRFSFHMVGNAARHEACCSEMMCGIVVRSVVEAHRPRCYSKAVWAG
jgi:hypothetical protein